jgi:tetratricopeptide (TPR) repeat protein
MSNPAAYRQVKGRLDLNAIDLGSTHLKNIAEPVHFYSLEIGQPARAKPPPFDFDAAIDDFHQAIDSDFRAYSIYAQLSAAYAQEGKMDEAKTALAEARRFRRFSMACARRGCPRSEHWLDGSR